MEVVSRSNLEVWDKFFGISILGWSVPKLAQKVFDDEYSFGLSIDDDSEFVHAVVSLVKLS